MKLEDKLTELLAGIGDGCMLEEDSPDVSFVPTKLLVDSPSASVWQAPPTFFPNVSGSVPSGPHCMCTHTHTLSDLHAVGAHHVDTSLMILPKIKWRMGTGMS